MSLPAEGGKAAYLDKGTWSSKAIKEAKKLGAVAVVASSADANYNYVPKTYEVPSDAAYLHYTSNNTIFGTEVFEAPKTGVPLVSDMSSDIMSRTLNVADYGLIYAGLRKKHGRASCRERVCQ